MNFTPSNNGYLQTHSLLHKSIVGLTVQSHNYFSYLIVFSVYFVIKSIKSNHLLNQLVCARITGSILLLRT